VAIYLHHRQVPFAIFKACWHLAEAELGESFYIIFNYYDLYQIRFARAIISSSKAQTRFGKIYLKS